MAGAPSGTDRSTVYATGASEDACKRAAVISNLNPPCKPFTFADLPTADGPLHVASTGVTASSVDGGQAGDDDLTVRCPRHDTKSPEQHCPACRAWVEAMDARALRRQESACGPSALSGMTTMTLGPIRLTT